MLTKEVWERTQKTSHFKTPLNSYQSKTWKRCENAVPTRSRPTTPLCLVKQLRSLMSDPLPAEAGCEACYSGLLYSWFLLRNNNTTINLQMFTSCYSSRRCAACDQGSQWGFLQPRSVFFSRPGCPGLVMKNRVKSAFFKVIDSSATSMCSTIERYLCITVFTCAHQVRKYAYRMKQNVKSALYSHTRSLSGLCTVVC